jgi:GNAT superfamily N-acetyltransferase
MTPTVHTRDLRPTDRAALAAIFERLGPHSRRQRFLGAKPMLTPRELSALAAVDGFHHAGVIAFARGAAIGVARFVRSDDLQVADTAIAVIDQWQGRGVGRSLLAQLGACARRGGVRRFRWTALASNGAVDALTSGLADRRRVGGSHGVVEWTASIALTAP